MAVTEVVEIERKYDLDEPIEPPQHGLPGVSAVDGPAAETLDAAYFDTADLRLLRSGVTLRRRRGGEDEGWHLKLPGARPGERIELRLPLGRRRRRVPKELVDLTLARTRGARLTRVARLRTERRRWRLLAGDTVVAEMVSDAVSAEPTGKLADRYADGQPSLWHELEVELLQGRRELLDELEPWLRQHGARPASAASKVGRALAGVLAQTRPADAGPDRGPARDSAGAVVLDYLRGQVEAILANDAKVRRDEPDSVHQMRVAARRARSTLQSFRGILDGERIEPVIEELRWLGTVLGPAREAEVQRGRLLRGLRALPPELGAGPLADRVDSHFSDEYARAHASALRELRGRRYLDLLDALHRLIEHPPLGAAAVEPAAKVLPRLVGRVQRRVRRRMRRAAEAEQRAAKAATANQPAEALTSDRAATEGDTTHRAGATTEADTAHHATAERDTAMHEARKAAKRARYAAEAVAPALGTPARRSAKRLKAVQSLLGDHQDIVVSRGELRRLASTDQAKNSNGFGYGVLAGQDLAEAARIRAELPDKWRRADRRKVRTWVT